jgi:hypothetical protein
MSRSLAVVADNTAIQTEVRSTENLSMMVQRLQAEARALAGEHVTAFGAAIEDLARVAAEIATGGDAYPVGAREMARQMLAACEGRKQSLDMMVGRSLNGGRIQPRRSAN